MVEVNKKFIVSGTGCTGLLRRLIITAPNALYAIYEGSKMIGCNVGDIISVTMIPEEV